MKTVTESLQFIPRIQERTRKETIRELVGKSLLAALLFLGISGNINSIFFPKMYYVILILLGLTGCVAFTIILDQKKRWLPGILITGSWIIIYSVVLQSDIFNGLRLCGNHVGEVLGQRFGRIYPVYFVTAKVQDYPLAVTLFLVPLCVLLSMICGYFAKTKDSVLSLTLVGTLLFGNGFLKIEISPLWGGLLIIAQMIMFIQCIGARKNFYQSGSKSFLKGTVFASLLVLIIMAIMFQGIPDYKQGPFIHARNNFIRFSDRIRYGGDASGGLPDGDFNDLHGYEPSSKTVLEVTMEKPESLWLRGYVGSIYNKNGWEKVKPQELYRWSDLFYWLHKDNFFGQKQLVDAALVSGKEMVNHSSGMKIRNIGASSRNIYAPYEFYYAKDDLLSLDLIGDETLNNSSFRGRREYEYVVFPNIVKRYPDIVNGLFSKTQSTPSMESFLHIESNYSEFVYKEYTQIPKETKVWMEKYLTDLDRQKENVNFTSAKQAIITYLTEKTSYTSKPAAMTGSDFAYDFLFTERSGYSVHYATAATLMFRYLGIPARYVEGYLITPKDVKDAKENVILKLDGTHSHAWTEVYLDGAGWIPVEVTPPYFGIMEEADSYEGVQGGTYDDNQGEVKDKEPNKAQDDLLDLDETEGIKNKRFPLWIIILIALFSGGLSGFVFFKVKKKRKWMQERLNACTDKQNSVAIKAMFVCSMESLFLLGIENDGVWLLHSIKDKIHHLFPAIEEDYDDIFQIFERAAYSKNDLSETEKEKMFFFLQQILAIMEKQTNIICRIKCGKYVRLIKRLIKSQIKSQI